MPLSERSERGIALIAVLLAMSLLLALAGGLVQVATTEAQIAVHHRAGLEAFYAADAVAESMRVDLARAAGVDALLAGSERSAFVDGDPVGVRLVHGVALDLSELTNVEQCGGTAPCSDAAIRVVTAERPWGANNPRWRLYGHGWMQQAVGAAEAPAVYLVVWIGDDPFETDGDPLRDGNSMGRARIALRVRAYGAHGTRREIDAVVGDVPRRPHVVWWQER